MEPKLAGGRNEYCGAQSVILTIALVTQQMRTAIYRFCSDERGQDLVEYTLLLGFVALGAATLFRNAGSSVNTIWTATSNTTHAAAVAAS